MRKRPLALPPLPDSSPPGVVPGVRRISAKALLDKPVDMMANASLPAAGSAMDGKIIIDTTNDRLVYYSNGQRRFLAAGTLF